MRAGLGDRAWPQIAADSVLVVPVGSTEQHGPHLPLSTDTDIAVGVALRLARARADVVVAPAVAYGSSGEHQGFPGTLSIGPQATVLLLVELVRSATETFDRVVLVSTHGGNADAVGEAQERLAAEGRRVLVWTPRWRGDAHAGFVETSVMLALAPDRVDLPAARRGNVRPLGELMPDLRAGRLAAVSPNGVLGDPAGATAQEGERLLGEAVDELVRAIDAWEEDR